MIGTAIGACRHLVSLVKTETYGEDGDGSFMEIQVPLEPARWFCSIRSVSVNRERQTSLTIESTATHVLVGRYHPQIDSTTRVIFGTRRLDVQSVQDVDERQQIMTVFATEILDRGADATHLGRTRRIPQ